MSEPDLRELFAPIDVSALSPATAGRQPTIAAYGPSLASKAASFTASMAKFAAGGFRTVSHQTYQDRFADCVPCPHYDLGLCRC